MDIHKRIAEILEKEESFCLVTVLDSTRSDIRPGQKAIVRFNRPIEGSLGSTELDASLNRLGQKALNENQSTVVEIESGCNVFLNVLCADAQLVICGAGHIALPLAQFSRKLGFQVTVIDDRSDFANLTRFPGCKVIAEEFTVALRGMTFGPATYVVVITRGHEHDVDCLIEIINKKTVYVGLIGSRRRVRIVLEALAEEGFPQERLNEVFTPIGLPIGAESPEEIALSIVSELVCVRRKGPDQARTIRKAVGVE
ncbi:MAG: XdhC/CoxI family protein [Desulfobacterales bacterium]|jgi:xanthine dehydrogenase accessory factor|nr:XdhC family protein [Deltaproteobacteria bacterium]